MCGQSVTFVADDLMNGKGVVTMFCGCFGSENSQPAVFKGKTACKDGTAANQQEAAAVYPSLCFAGPVGCVHTRETGCIIYRETWGVSQEGEEKNNLHIKLESAINN